MYSVAQSNLKLAMILLPQPSGIRSMCLAGCSSLCDRSGSSSPPGMASPPWTLLTLIPLWFLGTRGDILLLGYGGNLRLPPLHDSPLQEERVLVSLQLWEGKQASKSTIATPSRYRAQQSPSPMVPGAQLLSKGFLFGELHGTSDLWLEEMGCV